jgi:Skp family chaperone for outer membrane proteins
MSMIEYNTLNYIMYKEAMAKLAERENENKAARDDEIAKQRNYGSGSENISVLTDSEKEQYAKNNGKVNLGITENDLEQILEEEGLI